MLPNRRTSGVTFTTSENRHGRPRTQNGGITPDTATKRVFTQNLTGGKYMKKLRKVLALVLVIALAFSLVTMASAVTVKDYSDSASIKQTEAVDLFTQLGFLAGNGGAFNPTGTLTREAAAKIIAYMILGTTKADALKTVFSSYSDVAASRWSAGYIQYCSTMGIINGDGTGKFNPEANVTGTQFAKMLLTAVGYGKVGEYTGANWELAVIGDASRLGIFSLNVDVTAAATREEAAQYGFNTYAGVAQVVYNSESHSYQNAYDTLGAATVPTSAGTLANDQGVGWVTKVVNGVTYRYWINLWGVTLSGDYPTEAVIFTSTNGTTLVNLTTPSSTRYKGAVSTATGIFDIADATTAYYLNGVRLAVGAPLTALNNLADQAGVIVQFINLDGDAAAEKVVVINKTYIKLTAAPVVNANGTTTILGICNNFNSAFIKGSEGLVAGDRVLWYADEVGTIYIEKCQSITGQLTDWSFAPAITTMQATFGGTKYVHSELAPYGLGGTAAVDLFVAMNGANAFNKDATIWVDNGNNIVDIGLNSVPAAPTYGIVLDYQYNGALANSALVQVYKQDGTIGTYSVAGNNFGIVADQGASFAGVSVEPNVGTFGYLTQYVIGADGKITLIPGGVSAVDALVTPYAARSVAVDGTPDVALTTSSVVFYFDNDTAYNPVTNPISVTTTGYTNSIGAAATSPITYILNFGSTTHVAALLFSDDAKPYIPFASNYAYLTSLTVNQRNVGGIFFYDYSVMVDGVAKVLTSLDNSLFSTGGTPATRALGVYYYEANAAGNVTLTNQTTSMTKYFGAGEEIGTNLFSYFSFDHNNNTVYPAADADAQTVALAANCHFYRIVAAPTSLVELSVFSVAVGSEVEYIVRDAATGSAIAVYLA
jgi:hypothetical protein